MQLIGYFKCLVNFFANDDVKNYVLICLQNGFWW